MSTLNLYIEYVKEHTQNLNEIETIRWIYLDLGKRFSFDTKFAYGGNSAKKAIYKASNKSRTWDTCLETKTGICKSIALILEKVLKSVGVKCTTVTSGENIISCPHVYNLVKLKSKDVILLDLQQDLENIHTHSAPKKFGIISETGKCILSRLELEKIDKKIGYIGPDNYYSDDYLFLLKSDMRLHENFSSMAEFVITNLEPIYPNEVKYVELKIHHERLLNKLFNIDELKKIHQIDCYYKHGDEKEFIPTIYVDSDNKTSIFMYDKNEQRYQMVSLEEFAQKKKNGLIHLQGIPRLRKYVNKDDAR